MMTRGAELDKRGFPVVVTRRSGLDRCLAYLLFGGTCCQIYGVTSEFVVFAAIGAVTIRFAGMLE